jgi:hypothetical protein
MSLGPVGFLFWKPGALYGSVPRIRMVNRGRHFSGRDKILFVHNDHEIEHIRTR